jgi:hypothetical protein
MRNFSLAEIRSHLVKSFSLKECLAWFAAPLILVPVVIWIYEHTLPGYHFWVPDFLVLILGICAGLCSVTSYVFTFLWTTSFWRPVLITAAVSFMLLGNIGAGLSSAIQFEGDREILRPLTSQEIAERDRYYQDVLINLGTASAVIGGGIALACQGLIRLIRRQS